MTNVLLLYSGIIPQVPSHVCPLLLLLEENGIIIPNLESLTRLRLLSVGQCVRSERRSGGFPPL